MHDWLMNPWIHGALVGLGPAIGIDLLNFKQANGWKDFFSKFNVSTASFMWFKGLLFGALAGGGLNIVGM